MMRTLVLLALALMLVACGGEEAAPAEPETETETETESAAQPEPEPDLYPNEACARVIVVAWQGALAAGDAITRSEDEAHARADALRARIEGGEAIDGLARTDSDASSSGPRGGLLGTYTRESFPPIHEPIRDAVFELAVGELSDVVRAPYGYVVASRCRVEKIHTRHILVRHVGARNAPADIDRSIDDARTLAGELRGRVMADGADFAAIAREASEDSSADDGGDLGMVGRGLLAQTYEAAAWELEIDAISDVVQSDFGFHVIQRLADLPPDAP